MEDSSSISAPTQQPIVIDPMANTLQEMIHQIKVLTSQNQALQFQVNQLSSASSSSAYPAHSSVAPVSHVKFNPNKPPVFNGNSTLRDWTGAVDRWLIACKISQGAEQVAQVSTFLDPSLGSWWDSVKDQISDWASMKHKMEQRWQPASLSKLARYRLDAVRQRGSVTDYHNEFLSIVMHIEPDKITEQEKLHSFMRGLHPRLRDRMENSDKEYTDLQAAVNAATLFEERRRQFVQSQYPSNRFTFQRNPSASSSVSSSNNTSTPMELSHMMVNESDFADLWSDPVPVAAAAAANSSPVNQEATAVLKQLLNVMHSRPFGRPPSGQKHHKDTSKTGLPKLTKDEREKCMREGRCFRCREQGHMSNKCPNANSKTTPTPQKSEN